jgi:hypothetical protein
MFSRVQPPLSVSHASAALAAALAFAVSAPASAQASATQTGTAEANVIERFQIVAEDALRFGQFNRPTTAGTLTIAVSGAASATAGMTSGYNITQTGTGRGPASFHMLGTPNRFVIVRLPNRIDISNGSATMRIDNLTMNNSNVNVRLNSTGYFLLLVGGRLNVGANQQAGYYTGTFDVTAIYQ